MPKKPLLSVQFAIPQEFQRLGYHVQVNYEIEGITSPDSRKPYGDVVYRLWTDDHIPQPALPKPNPVIAKKVADIAQSNYYLDIWWSQGRTLGRELGANAVQDLLSLMVHPPISKRDECVWNWIRRIQFAAAFTAANVDMGWDGSVRKDVVSSLILGPMDWTVEAGLIAAGKIAQNDPNLSEEILALFRDRYRGIPGTGHTCYLMALCLPVLTMMDISDEDRKPFIKLWESLSDT